MSDGRVYRVDSGGCLSYRARGKQKAFHGQVTELRSLKNSNAFGYSAFSDSMLSRERVGAANVATLPRSTIESLVLRHGPKDLTKKKALLNSLCARQRDIIKRYPVLGLDPEAVYFVEPQGYEIPDKLFDPGKPILEFDNSQWRWLDFSQIRSGALGNKPLRKECSDIFQYLAFEQARIQQQIQSVFPGVTIRIVGANADWVFRR